jgi:hypothetical protein
MVEWVTSSELDRLGRKQSWSNWRYCHDICVEGLRKTACTMGRFTVTRVRLEPRTYSLSAGFGIKILPSVCMVRSCWHLFGFRYVVTRGRDPTHSAAMSRCEPGVRGTSCGADCERDGEGCYLDGGQSTVRAAAHVSLPLQHVVIIKSFACHKPIVSAQYTFTSTSTSEEINSIFVIYWSLSVNRWC